MKNFLYACRNVFRLRITNCIKIISLTLGLFIGSMVFARVAFEGSIDNFYPDIDRIYQVVDWGDTDDPMGEMLFEPVAQAIAAEYPEIERTTHLYRGWERSYFHGQDKYSTGTIYADSALFDVLDFGVVRGDPKVSLARKNNIFISESYAERIFKESDPIGQVITLGKSDTLTVSGIFRDIPENSVFYKVGAIISFPTLSKSMGMEWGGGDSFRVYAKFRPGADVAAVETTVMDRLQKYFDYKDLAAKGWDIKYRFVLYKDMYGASPEIQRIVIMMALLSFIVIFISAMNYVLLSLSSLTSRAKEVGVHKCSGASSWRIFSMFMYETLVYVILAIMLTIILAWALQSDLEQSLDASFATLFSGKNLWAAGIVIMVLFLTSGVLPARMFSSISVSQIFRRYTESKRIWKRALLFIQFAGTGFIFALLMIMTNQYNTLVTKDLGYNTHNLTYAEFSVDSGEKRSTLKQEIGRMDEVDGITFADVTPFYGMSGTMITDPTTQENILSSRFFAADDDFLEVMGIKVSRGRNFGPGDSVVLVNQTLAERLSNTSYGDVMGKPIFESYPKSRQVVGIVDDFHVGSLYSTQQPLVIYSMRKSRSGGVFIIRLKELSQESINAVNKKFDQLAPDSEAIRLVSYEESIKDMYYSVMLLRNGVMVASLTIILITVMGIVGYVATETRRRSREIAIRKVTGATSADVIGLFIRNIIVLAASAAVVGSALAYFVGDMWQSMFAVKAPFSIWVFIISIIAVLMIVGLITIIQTWKIANENPVNSIKSE